MYTHQQSAFFDRADIAIPCAHEFFKRAHKEEQDHTWKLIKFQNMRGGNIVLQDVRKPERDEWGSLREAIQASLELEKHVNQSLLDLYKTADQHGDAQVCQSLRANLFSLMGHIHIPIGLGHLYPQSPLFATLLPCPVLVTY